MAGEGLWLWKPNIVCNPLMLTGSFNSLFCALLILHTTNKKYIYIHTPFENVLKAISNLIDLKVFLKIIYNKALRSYIKSLHVSYSWPNSWTKLANIIYGNTWTIMYLYQVNHQEVGMLAQEIQGDHLLSHLPGQHLFQL